MSDLRLPVPGVPPSQGGGPPHSLPDGGRPQQETPVPEGRERGDAARNRRHLLATAARLIAENGADALTMDCLAEQAGMGKGTIFRRFGNRSGLMFALLDQSEKDFQRAILAGPAPLGPGAEPRERLLAFGRAAVDRFERAGELQEAADVSSRQRFEVPARRFVRQHIGMLLRQSGLGPEADVEL
ncbi:MAG TPA: TetR/AcrR family transcriptional regulator, partial [Micrococcaceae bacterium]